MPNWLSIFVMRDTHSLTEFCCDYNVSFFLYVSMIEAFNNIQAWADFSILRTKRLYECLIWQINYHKEIIIGRFTISDVTILTNT